MVEEAIVADTTSEASTSVTPEIFEPAPNSDIDTISSTATNTILETSTISDEEPISPIEEPTTSTHPSAPAIVNVSENVKTSTKNNVDIPEEEIDTPENPIAIASTAINTILETSNVSDEETSSPIEEPTTSTYPSASAIANVSENAKTSTKNDGLSYKLMLAEDGAVISEESTAFKEELVKPVVTDKEAVDIPEKEIHTSGKPIAFEDGTAISEDLNDPNKGTVSRFVEPEVTEKETVETNEPIPEKGDVMSMEPTILTEEIANFGASTTVWKEINVLLLGETGVGKSTFINSFANYMKHDDFYEAEGDKLSVLIATNFNIFDKNLETHNIKIGSNDDENECLEVGQSGTQDVKTYIFNVVEKNKHYKIRLIDTPGMGDPRGIEQDNANAEAILNYLGNFQELHAICMLFNPTNSKVTVFLSYCIHQILSRLSKSASKNMAFLFTNTRGHNYTPGETYCCLKKVIEELKDKSKTEIPLSVENVFCFDNEAFRFLAAVRQGVEFKDGIKEANVESWRYSSKEVWRLITYIIGDESRTSLTPHNTVHSISINNARKMIKRLTTPLAEIVQLISDNIYQLTKHTDDLTEKTHTIEELKQKMHMPVVNLRVKKLLRPVTVCTDAKCATIYRVADKNKYHYKQRCHNPCSLRNVTKETVGDPALLKCRCINKDTQRCTKCGCRYNVHMHIYYETETYDDRIIDKNVVKNITTEKEATRQKQLLIDKMVNQKEQCEQEHAFIVKATATFAEFLAHNAISPTNDSISEYIEYLITREENNIPAYRSKETIDSLKRLLREYDEEKNVLKEALSMSTGDFSTLSPESIEKNITDLYNLKHFGAKIEELVRTQETAIRSEHSKNEVFAGIYYSARPQNNKRGRGRKSAQNQHFGYQNAKNSFEFGEGSQYVDGQRYHNTKNYTQTGQSQYASDHRYQNTRNYTHVTRQNEYSGDRRFQSTNHYTEAGGIQYSCDQRYQNSRNFTHVTSQNEYSRDHRFQNPHYHTEADQGQALQIYQNMRHPAAKAGQHLYSGYRKVKNLAKSLWSKPPWK